MAMKEAKDPRLNPRRAKAVRKGHPRFYDTAVDYEFLEGNGIKVVKHEPWQLGLFHEELTGKFLWYPSAGTLVFESEDHFFSRVGQKGDFLAGGHHADEAREYVTEDVYEKIMEMVHQQNV